MRLLFLTYKLFGEDFKKISNLGFWLKLEGGGGTGWDNIFASWKDFFHHQNFAQLTIKLVMRVF